MKKCNEKLRIFGLKNFTYINQFFGNDVVKEKIEETYKNKNLKLVIEEISMGKHHTVQIGKNKLNYACSVDTKVQNISVDKNDTLCQSYSLLYYLKYPNYQNNIYKNKLRRQYEIIKMYRELLHNRLLLHKIFWGIDDTKPQFTNYEKPVKKDKNGEDIKNLYYKTYYTTKINEKIVESLEFYKNNNILKKIEETLNDWDNFGYIYYIEKGKCPSDGKITPLSTIFSHFPSSPSSPPSSSPPLSPPPQTTRKRGRPSSSRKSMTETTINFATANTSASTPQLTRKRGRPLSSRKSMSATMTAFSLPPFLTSPHNNQPENTT